MQALCCSGRVEKKSKDNIQHKAYISYAQANCNFSCESAQQTHQIKPLLTP